MSRRTIAGFTAYEANGGGAGVPLIAKGAVGEAFLAAADGTITGTQVDCYKKETGVEYTPFSNIHGYVETFWVEVPELSTAPGIYFVSGVVRTFQPFLEGQRGKPGLPGTNGVATDEAVATNLLTSGTSTRSAAFGLIDDVITPIWDERTREVVADTGSATRTLLNVLYGGNSGGGGGGMAAGFVSVLDYGAVGDGIADDAPAIQVALDDNAGIIVFPAGYTFSCQAPLRLKQGNTIMAYGATIRRDGPANHLVRNYLEASWGGVNDDFPGYTGNSDITIEGGTWDQNYDINHGGNAFTFAHCKNMTVRDAAVIRNGSHAFDLPGVDGMLIENCWMLGFKVYASHKEAVQIDSASTGAASMRPIDGTPSKNITVRDCRVAGYTDPVTQEVWLSAARLSGSHSVSSTGALFENIQILNNVGIDLQSRGVSPYAWNNFLVDGNRFVNCGTSGVRVSTAAGYPVTSGTVQNNHVINNQTDFAFVCDFEGTADELRNIKFLGNTSENSSNAGIVIGVSTGCVVGNNHVRGAAVDKPGTRWSYAFGAGSVDGFMFLNTATKSGAPEEASAGLYVSDTAVRPRYVLNNLLDGLTVDDQNSGSITT